MTTAGTSQPTRPAHRERFSGWRRVSSLSWIGQMRELRRGPRLRHQRAGRQLNGLPTGDKMLVLCATAEMPVLWRKSHNRGREIHDGPRRSWSLGGETVIDYFKFSRTIQCRQVQPEPFHYDSPCGNRRSRNCGRCAGGFQRARCRGLAFLPLPRGEPHQQRHRYRVLSRCADQYDEPHWLAEPGVVN